MGRKQLRTSGKNEKQQTNNKDMTSKKILKPKKKQMQKEKLKN